MTFWSFVGFARGMRRLLPLKRCVGRFTAYGSDGSCCGNRGGLGGNIPSWSMVTLHVHQVLRWSIMIMVLIMRRMHLTETNFCQGLISWVVVRHIASAEK